ncbi:hypothetical protein Tcan_15864 [Toxocara canis]|uniref:Uncharacterized protein n=1 Tax=Toxocara canis TaxID=6265 RepID=A0A0B2UZZ2_TOXCA|nr:hypothetical protein Tcan_15864 [Toxocara canis]
MVQERTLRYQISNQITPPPGNGAPSIQLITTTITTKSRPCSIRSSRSTLATPATGFRRPPTQPPVHEERNCRTSLTHHNHLPMKRKHNRTAFYTANGHKFNLQNFLRALVVQPPSIRKQEMDKPSSQLAIARDDKRVQLLIVRDDA